MKKEEKKENLKIDLFNLEKEKISAQALGNILAGHPGCKCMLDPHGEFENETLIRIF